MHTHAAFFHHATTADSYIWIQLITKVFRPYRFPIVERPCVIGAIVTAISSTDTSVVDLNVETFGVVVRSVHGTHWFTRGVFAVLAENWNEACFDVGPFSLPVPLDPNPLNSTPFDKGRLFIDRNIVL